MCALRLARGAERDARAGGLPEHDHAAREGRQVMNRDSLIYLILAVLVILLVLHLAKVLVFSLSWPVLVLVIVLVVVLIR